MRLGTPGFRCFALAIAALTLAIAPPAAAQNFFQQLFGFFHRPHIAQPADADPSRSGLDAFARAPDPQAPREARASGSGICVRTCDGFHFAVRASRRASAADMCHAFCPGSETRVYSGSNLDYATASDGSRYANLDTAYEYRKRLVPGCTCNGHSPFGLAHISVDDDPTLQPGDVVATKNGLMAVNGTSGGNADFTPVQSYRGFSKSYRDALSQIRVAPPGLEAPDSITSSAAPASTAENDSSAAR